MALPLLVALGLFALLILLLAPPVVVRYEVNRVECTDGYVALQCWFGLVRFQRSLGGAKDASGRRPKSPPKRASKGGKRRSRPFFNMLKNAAFRSRVWRFAKDLLRALHANGVYLRARIGMEDPSDTGMLWAWAGPLAGIARSLSFADIDVAPDFLESGVTFQSGGRLRLFPLQIITLCTGFLLSPVTLRTWYGTRRSVLP